MYVLLSILILLEYLYDKNCWKSFSNIYVKGRIMNCTNQYNRFGFFINLVNLLMCVAWFFCNMSMFHNQSVLKRVTYVLLQYQDAYTGLCLGLFFQYVHLHKFKRFGWSYASLKAENIFGLSAAESIIILNNYIFKF